MNTTIRFCVLSAVVALCVAPVLAQPKEFHDDFSTVATYDSASLLAGCPSIGGPLSKYTMFEFSGADIYNSRAISGGGRLVVSNRIQESTLGPIARLDWVIVGVADTDVTGCTIPGAPDQTFTDPDTCIYGGCLFQAFDVAYGFQSNGFGPDGQPGKAGVDDDCDGTTDEKIGQAWYADESPVHSGGDTFGPPYSDGGSAGCPNFPTDGLPGIGGVDDDGDGTIDDYGELGMGNDSDDNGGRQYRGVGMKLDYNIGSMVALNIDAGSGGGNLFSLISYVAVVGSYVSQSNEITTGYYQPDRHYNYAFCVSGGTCFGAVLWEGTDMANPAETVGPATNSQHTASVDRFVALSMNASAPQYQRAKQWAGCTNFGDEFWICEGALYPAPSADLDRDKDVDGFDFLTFSNCYNGSNRPPLAACASGLADLDLDGDVDGFDFLTFSNCYNGSNRRPLAACMPPNVTNCAS